MHVISSRASILPALARVTSIVEAAAPTTNSTVLSHVKVEAHGETLTIRGSDTRQEITARIPVTVKTPGAALIQGKMMHSIIGKAVEGEVLIGANSKGARIVAGAARFDLRTLAPEAYPVFRGADGDVTEFMMPATTLAATLTSIRFAVLADESRPILAGVHMHVDGDLLCIVATNGPVLARRKLPLPDGAAAMPPTTIPRRSIDDLIRVLDAADVGNVKCRIAKTRAEFVVGDISLATKLIEGDFPKYARVIPPLSPNAAVGRTADIIRGLELMEAIVDRGKAVKWRVNGALTLSAKNYLGHSSEDVVDIAYSGPPVEVGFSPKLMLSILSEIESDAQIHFGADGGSATLITCDAMPDASYVVMPMRTS